MLLREVPAQYPIEALLAECNTHNSKRLSRCRPANDVESDKAAWKRTEEELQAQLLRRFGTWEQYGGAPEPTVRLIDDALEGGQNGATGSQCTRRTADLDTWATQCRMVQERFPTSALSKVPSDFKKARRNQFWQA